MAYNSYFPTSYQYPSFTQQQQMPQQQNNNGIIWIQGEGAARSFLVAPNTSVVLFDSDDPMFYIKSADQSGMPLLKKFRYEEVTDTKKVESQALEASPVNMNAYITREEFESRLAELTTQKRTTAAARKERTDA